MYEVNYKVWTDSNYYGMKYRMIEEEGKVSGKTLEEAMNNLPIKVKRWTYPEKREIEVKHIKEA